jgi:dihydrofolate reductase
LTIELTLVISPPAISSPHTPISRCCPSRKERSRTSVDLDGAQRHARNACTQTDQVDQRARRGCAPRLALYWRRREPRSSSDLRAEGACARRRVLAGGAETADPELADQIEFMNALPKYVLTHGEADTSWANSRAIDVDSIAELKADAKRPLALFGGARAAQAALARDQVDELRLVQFPVLLGGGTPLFAADRRRRALTPVETQPFGNGPTLTRYVLAESSRASQLTAELGCSVSLEQPPAGRVMAEPMTFFS